MRISISLALAAFLSACGALQNGGGLISNRAGPVDQGGYITVINPDGTRERIGPDDTAIIRAVGPLSSKRR